MDLAASATSQKGTQAMLCRRGRIELYCEGYTQHIGQRLALYCMVLSTNIRNIIVSRIGDGCHAWWHCHPREAGYGAAYYA